MPKVNRIGKGVQRPTVLRSRKKRRRYVKKPIPVTAVVAEEKTPIKTLEGVVTAQPGDYIVTGPAGESWPVKKEIFEKTYREVDGKFVLRR